MRSHFIKKALAGSAVAVAAVAGASGAHAASSSQSFTVPYGTLYVSAWECNTYIKSCDWYTKVQLQKNGGRIMDRITNTTTISANGINATVNVSKTPSATLSGNQTKMATVKWTKYVSNLVELRGTATPSWTAVGITTKSCLTGNGPGSYGEVSAKCTQIGLW
ncbi:MULTISPECIES: hypothetical protein [Actinomycetes]|uniref:hypothetical protein n=1 Tax=Actinomycetes TaxID=1760 RepID=UPI00265068F1|nr:hypothetical protein [Corynebacterium glyciniphilum]MDN5684372.1 hypothetical protein [Corynebacterium glyciniphilum]